MLFGRGPEGCMSSNDSRMTRAEIYGLAIVSVLLGIWYATPQLFFSIHPLYELARLLVPEMVAAIN